jgi:hypothetical protein
MMKKLFICLILLFPLITWSQTEQVKPPVIQFSGIITHSDSLYGIAGAAIISLSSGAGVNSNLMGYFSIPVFAGDSILVACLGFKKRYLNIPSTITESYSVVIEMKGDTLILPEIDLYAFPSEEVFKQIILAMEQPKEGDYANMQANINEQILTRIMYKSDMAASVSFRNSMDRQAQFAQRKYALTVNPFLDPFAWARFIREVKAQKAKKDLEEKETKNNRKY